MADIGDPDYDIAIIGGGINGCGIARDAAGRGWSVFLCEANDLASGTSSASTKLIHGGLRYLEYLDFRLVREALKEREVLWRIAPHIVHPLRFILPHHKGLRPRWLLRLGLFLYDHLGGRNRLPPTRTVRLHHDPAGRPLKPEYRMGFEYSDCSVDDSRLVVLNAYDAAAKGATIATRTRCEDASRSARCWRLTVRDTRTGQKRELTARAIVNAAGPWMAEVLTRVLHAETPPRIRLVQGSHIVVPRLYPEKHCYIFQNADRRILFVIPYESDFTLIGTTDRDYYGDPGRVSASPEEIDYLCRAASEYLKRPISPSDVVWSYSGVRSLVDDGVSQAPAATRDYVLHLEASGNQPPALSIFGGKITTYRRLAEAALARLAPYLPPATRHSPGWTGKEPLPGGGFAVDGFDDELRKLATRYPFVEGTALQRMLRAYGTCAFRMLGNAAAPSDLGRVFGAGLTEVEVRYLVREEWAATAEDILWRRSKLGLRFSRDEAANLSAFLAGLLPSSEAGGAPISPAST